MYIIIAHRSFENIKTGLKIWKIILVFIIYELIAAIVLIFELGPSVKLWVIVDMVLGFIFALSVCKYNLGFKERFEKIISVIILFLILTELCINSFYSMKEIQEKSSMTEMEYYVSLTNFYDYLYGKLKESDNSLYRIENRYRINRNDGLVFGYNGISYSGSTYSKNLYNFLANMGYACQHVVISSDMGNTRVSDMLLGIKYVMNTEQKVGIKNYEDLKIDDNITIYKNPYTLGLGYSVSSNILEKIETKNSNAFDYQNKLMKSLTNLEEDIFVKHQGRIQEKTQNLTKDGIKFCVIDEKEEAKISYEFEVEKEEEAYIYFLGINLDKTIVSINGEEIPCAFAGNSNKMVPLGKYNIRR